ncbi:contact-dependent growth inhibition system immunity protein [Burkholderia dolosa]|jgi:hypothetical protein|uniref:contact-dependent growth inhibition system immunity protein n=1 Tax=Burkholderia dolosa TaxID=152500 RepID=UPI001B93E369|nr:contact-dependent growth inhibition system immunity protein [Burkholderia dolosa]MBR8056418.1 hypothetical protein [Burkholderia dolosa]MBR8312587.1 hypothetical protein [Burkholderia dolosa]MBR8459241.1 hypothetical protein [Burkholderia dolosa]MDN7423803.1 contact-dependent growth inhibition system immunity protein [Burkholderia dolosa]
MDYHDFPHLLTIASGYLGQDWRSWGDSFEGVVALYKSETTQEERAELLKEIDLFEKKYATNLDDEFIDRYGHDFDPSLRGFTTASFFEALRQLLKT